MKKGFRNYLDSFKFNKDHLRSVIVDVLTISIIYGLFVAFAGLLNKKALIMFEGQSPEQIQTLLATSPTELLPFLTQLKSFLIIALVGLLILLIVTFLVYVFSRSYLWSYLSKKKLTHKIFWHWVGFSLAMIIPLILIGIIFAIVKMIFSLIFGITNIAWLSLLLNNIVSVFLFVALLTFVFHVYKEFSEKRQIWNAIGKGFSVFGKKLIWRKLALGFLTIVVIIIILSFIPGLASIILSIILFILFITWYRLYAI